MSVGIGEDFIAWRSERFTLEAERIGWVSLFATLNQQVNIMIMTLLITERSAVNFHMGLSWIPMKVTACIAFFKIIDKRSLLVFDLFVVIRRQWIEYIRFVKLFVGVTLAVTLFK